MADPSPEDVIAAALPDPARRMWEESASAKRRAAASDIVAALTHAGFAFAPSAPEPHVLAEVSRVLHVMGCVKGCDGDPSGWEANAKIIYDIILAPYRPVADADA